MSKKYLLNESRKKLLKKVQSKILDEELKKLIKLILNINSKKTFNKLIQNTNYVKEDIYKIITLFKKNGVRALLIDPKNTRDNFMLQDKTKDGINRVSQILKDTYAILASKEFLYHFGRKKSGSFTRKRKLPFTKLISLIMFCSGVSTSTNIFNFIKNIDDEKNKPSDKAYFNAVKKLKSTVFNSINKIFLKKIYENTDMKLHKGYFLLGIDGSDSEIPNTIKMKKSVGVVSGPIKDINRNPARCSTSAIMDLLNKYTIDLTPYEYKKGEVAMFKDRFSCINETINRDYIIIGDRNYGCINMIGFLMMHNVKFLLRVKKDSYIHERNAMTSNDEMIDLKLNKRRLNRIDDDNVKDYLKDKSELKLRYTKYTIPKTSEVEYLISNLSFDEFSLSDLGELYNVRWQEEVTIRTLKESMGITDTIIQSKEGIDIEMGAKTFMYNISRAYTNVLDEAIKEDEKRNINRNDFLVMFGADLITELTTFPGSEGTFDNSVFCNCNYSDIKQNTVTSTEDEIISINRKNLKYNYKTNFNRILTVIEKILLIFYSKCDSLCLNEIVYNIFSNFTIYKTPIRNREGVPRIKKKTENSHRSTYRCPR